MAYLSESSGKVEHMNKTLKLLNARRPTYNGISYCPYSYSELGLAPQKRWLSLLLKFFFLGVHTL
jgi:hypothetical protein